MLSIKNLEAGYGKVKVLHGISIDVPKSQVITLIGSNGAGKTTTMRAVTGMIKPTAGEITLSGQRIDGADSYTIARLGLAHSPEGRRVFSTMSVTDNLLLGAFPRLTGSRPKGDVKGDLERAMDLFPRLKERRNQLAGTLSGGEQQMLAMARAVMLNPEIVYPGDAYVDYIGIDAYDAVWTAYGAANPLRRWNDYYVNQTNALQWQVDFAKAHNKMLSMPEWGCCGKNAGDDPFFVNQMAAWLKAHNYAYADYWDSNSAYPGMLTGGQYPKAGAAYIADFK